MTSSIALCLCGTTPARHSHAISEPSRTLGPHNVIECPKCGMSTKKWAPLAEAIKEWEELVGVKSVQKNWTDEPWFVGTQNDINYLIDRRPNACLNDAPNHEADVEPIAKFYDTVRGAKHGDGNVQRARACVNFLADHPDLDKVQVVSKDEIAQLRQQCDELAELRKDRARFEWYFSDTPKNDFLHYFMEGVAAGYDVNQWRMTIDAAINRATK